MKLLWLTDLHLNQADWPTQKSFYERLRNETYDAVVITGDISIPRLLSRHLKELARACASQKVYFVLGNHDFEGSNFAAVDAAVAECCRAHPNLQHLGMGEVVPLTSTTALVGHRGWADARAWGGKWIPKQRRRRDNDSNRRFQASYASFHRMKRLGRISAGYFRKILPDTLPCYRRVVIATHVPPFARAVRFDGSSCAAEKLPHFVNASAGGVIMRIGEYFPKTKMTVLCGHTHHGVSVQIAPNLEVHVGKAQARKPMIQGIINV